MTQNITPEQLKQLKQLEDLFANLNNHIQIAIRSAEALLDDKSSKHFKEVALINYEDAISKIDGYIEHHLKTIQVLETIRSQIYKERYYKERLKFQNDLFEVTETFKEITISDQKQAEIKTKQNSIEDFYNIQLDGLDPEKDLKEIWTVDDKLDNLFYEHPEFKDLTSFSSGASGKTSDNKDFSRLQKMHDVGHYPFRILKALRNKFKVKDKTGNRQQLLSQDEENPKSNKPKPN